MEPSLDRLPGYIAALEAGWSPDTTRDVSKEQLAAIRQDAGEFLCGLVEHEGRTVTLDDGSKIPRLPGRVFWIWGSGSSGTETAFQPSSSTFCGSRNGLSSPRAI